MIGVWIVVWSFTKGQQTLDLPGRESTDLHDSLTEFRNGIIAGRDTNPVMQVTNAIAEAFRNIVDWFQRMIARPNLPRPVPDSASPARAPLPPLSVPGHVTRQPTS